MSFPMGGGNTPVAPPAVVWSDAVRRSVGASRGATPAGSEARVGAATLGTFSQSFHFIDRESLASNTCPPPRLGVSPRARVRLAAEAALAQRPEAL